MSGIEARDNSMSRGGLGLFSIFTENKWYDDSVVLQFNISGYVGRYGSTETSRKIEENLRSFCGLGIAIRLFKIDKKYRSTPTKANFYIHKYENDNWIVQGVDELDTSVSDTFNDLVVHDLDGALDTPEKTSTWMTRRFSEINVVFENLDRTKKLLLACQWLFESYSGKNELLSFVQTTVVIEILLGDKVSSDQMGLGVLLRNRCAYLIGSSQSQRDKILKDFQEIYDVRSKIVHGGKSRINYRERTLLSTLQWMCRRVIQEEVKLMIEDVKKSA
jgi:hypothetical protein